MSIKSVILATAAGCALVSTSPLSAQDAPVSPAQRSRWEFLIPSGTIIPVGEQRDAIKRGNITAAQLSFVVRPTVAVTTVFAWARSRDVATAGDPKLDVFTYDVGAELRTPQQLKRMGMSFSAFAGAGAGGRSYNYRKLEVDATHNLAAYGSVGGEVAVRRVALRVEARDYVAGFKPLTGAGESRTGNDVVIMAGLRLLAR